MQSRKKNKISFELKLRLHFFFSMSCLIALIKNIKQKIPENIV